MTDEELEQMPLVRMANSLAKGVVVSRNYPLEQFLAKILGAFAEYHLKVLTTQTTNQQN